MAQVSQCLTNRCALDEYSISTSIVSLYAVLNFALAFFFVYLNEYYYTREFEYTNTLKKLIKKQTRASTK